MSSNSALSRAATLAEDAAASSQTGQDPSNDIQPREAKEKARTRLSLEVSPQLNNLLEHLADQLGVTKSDVLRKAVVLMKVAVEANQQGKKMGIAEKDQPLSTEIVGLF